MKVVARAITELKEDPNNARSHDEENVDAIKASLVRFGQVEPLVVREGSEVVVGGNGRLRAMRALGWLTAVVTYVDISDNEAAALGIALNRTAELADWNYENLASILKMLQEHGEDLSSLGWTEDQVDILLASTDWEPPPFEDESNDDRTVMEKEPAGVVFVTVALPSEDLRPLLKEWCRDNDAKLVK